MTQVFTAHTLLCKMMQAIQACCLFGDHVSDAPCKLITQCHVKHKRSSSLSHQWNWWRGCTCLQRQLWCPPL